MGLLQEHDLSVRSIAFDAPHGADTKHIAYVRLMPPTLSWRSNGTDTTVSFLYFILAVTPLQTQASDAVPTHLRETLPRPSSAMLFIIIVAAPLPGTSA